MKRLLIMLLFISSNLYSQGCLKMDIMILFDMSASIFGNEHKIENAANIFIEGINLSNEGIRAGIVAYNSDTFGMQQLTSDKSLLFAATKYISSRKPDYSTNMSNALSVAQSELLNERSVQKMVIIITDGDPDDRGKTYIQAMLMQDIGILVAAIFIKTGDSNEPFLESICTPGMYIRTSYKTLATEIMKLDICL